MKILMVDDHVLFREGVAMLLESRFSGVELLQAGTCDTAFALLDERQDVDLVLMDLNLPGMQGLEGIAVMKARFPELPVVALSSSDDRETILAAVDAGAMGFIPKNSSASVLASALQLIIDKSIYLPAHIFLPERGARREMAIAPASSVTAGVTPAELGLTPRQSEVLFLVLQGKPAKIICRELGLSSSTVKVHTSAVLRALNVTTRTQAVVAAGKLGLRYVPPPG